MHSLLPPLMSDQHLKMSHKTMQGLLVMNINDKLWNDKVYFISSAMWFIVSTPSSLLCGDLASRPHWYLKLLNKKTKISTTYVLYSPALHITFFASFSVFFTFKRILIKTTLKLHVYKLQHMHWNIPDIDWFIKNKS